MTQHSCPICLNQLVPFIISENFTIYKCLNCGLGITESLKAQQGEYHRDNTYIEEEDLFRNIFLKRVNILMKIINPKNVLEVGCSTGLMLSLFKKLGCGVLGVEMSKRAAEVAEKEGVKVLNADFLKTKINENFDLVVFNHTLEHVADPSKFIKKAVGLLRSDGFLYIDLPNFDSVTSKLLKVSWPLLLPKEHLWHFTPKALTLILKKYGFKVVFMEMASGIWDYQNPIYGLMLSLIQFKKRFFKEVVTAVPSWITSRLQIGSDLMVIAKKI